MVPSSFIGWKKLRQQNARRNQLRLYPVIPQEFTDFCEYDGQDIDLLPPILRKTDYKIKFYFTSYPRLQSGDDGFLKDLHKENPKSKRSSASVSFSTNSIQQQLYDRIYGGMAELDQDWLIANDYFIKGLTIREKFALVSMTNKSQQHVQAYLRGIVSSEFRQRVRSWKSKVYGFLPIYFPLTDTYPGLTYDEIVANVCPHLTDKEINAAIASLCEEVRIIFKHAPMTTKRMVLLRGIKKEHTRQKRSGFVSLTLDPNQALVYMGTDSCCLQRVVVLPKTRMLFLGGLSSFPEDMECLLSDDTLFTVLGKSYQVIPLKRKPTSLCPDSKDTKRVMIHDIVAI